MLKLLVLGDIGDSIAGDMDFRTRPRQVLMWGLVWYGGVWWMVIRWQK